MNPDHQSKEQDLQNREAALKEREIKVRMRELEAEIEDSAPVLPTTKHKETLSHPWYKSLPKIAKFGLVIVGVIVAVRLVAWLAGVLILLWIGWAGYKIFLEGDQD